MSSPVYHKTGISLYAIVVIASFIYIYAQYLDGLNLTGLSDSISLYVAYTFWLHFLVLVSLGSLFAFAMRRILNGRNKVYLTLIAVTAIVLTFYLYIDSKIYSTVNLHINRFVIENLLQEDAQQVIGVSVKQIALSNWPLLFLLGVHLFISPLSKYRLFSVSINKKGVAIFLLVLFVLVGFDKLLFSYLYYRGQPIVFQLRDMPPGYITPNSYHIRRLFGFLLGKDSRVNFTQPMDIRTADPVISAINYPGQEELGSTVINPPYNIVMVVAESLRMQDVNADTAPFYTDLTREAIHANNHYTGGNCTHFGLFSLFYGLNPYYFHDFRMGLIPPAAISIFQRNGYKIYSTAARTMKWYDLEKFLLGSNPVSFVPAEGKNYERDRMVTDTSIEIARRHQESGEPYFNFIYYYTTHADYEHPDEYSQFEPEIKGKIDYSDNNLKGRDRVKLRNRYRNAIRFTDSELERLVNAIRKIGAWDNTILVFTADHGEELFEEGSFGHNTNLNQYQIKVPLLMHIPGKDAISIEKMTSHMDVMQTILGVIAGPNLDAVPFQGRNMLTGESGAIYIAKAHYQRPTAYAILDEEYKAIVNLDGGFLEVESISGPGNPGNIVSHALSSDVMGLISQMRELKTASMTTDREQKSLGVKH